MSKQSSEFSPNGEILASGSFDHTIKLWAVDSGNELRELSGHSNIVSTVAFSPDGNLLASGSIDGTVKLWDVKSGKELRTLGSGIFGLGAVYSASFSPDGKTLASGGGNLTIKLWDVESGKELHTLEGHSSTVHSVSFSPNGRILVSGSEDRTIKLWDVESGKELRTLTGHFSGIYSASFSLDGTTLVSGGQDTTIKLWDVKSGKELQTLKGHSDHVNSVSFSPDGKTLVSGGEDKTIKLWDVKSGKELRTFKGHFGSVRSVSFSPDGKQLASGSLDYTIKLWDVDSGKELRTFAGDSGSVRSVLFSPDGKILAFGSGDNTIKLWDIESGKEPRILKGHSSYVFSVSFSPDGKALASGSEDNTIKLWDVDSGKELRTLNGHLDAVKSVGFSPDGKTLVSGSDDETIKLWDVESGKELRTLPGGSFISVSFSPDGKTLASADSSVIRLWDVGSGQELKTLDGPSFSTRSVTFSLDGKILAFGLGSIIKLWDVESGKELHTPMYSPYVSSVAFSPDGKTLVSGSEHGTITLWNVESGEAIQTFQGHSNTVSSISFNPNRKMFATASWDGKIKLWDQVAGKELCSLITFNEHDWIVVTPNGLFDGSPAAWNKIIWRFNNTFNYTPVEAFFSDFYYPGLLADIFAGKRPTAPSDIAQKDRRQPQLKLSLVTAQPNAPLTVRNMIVKIDVSQAPAGAQDVRLFRNGSLVKVWRGDVLKRRRGVTLEAAIPIIAGENNLTAYAFNRDNIKSSDASLVVTGSESLKRQGKAYILAIGVNSYSNPQYNLKYAVADAQAFSAEVKRQQELLKNYGRIEVISLTDGEATKTNILQKLAQLARRVQPEDAVIVYFAGHGTAQQSRFYLIPHDLGYMGERTKLNKAGLREILAHSISDRELEQFFEKIDAGQTLLVIDACNSGQALESEEKRRGPMNSKGLAQLAYEKGMYILTAAQSYQAALEAAQLGHGYLTYALVVEGLTKGAADDAPKDNTVFVREWLDYATARVPQMQFKRLKEARDLGEEFSFIEGEARDVALDKWEVQRPRVFYRREIEAHPLVVARTQ